jgi:hypothetical protein
MADQPEDKDGKNRRKFERVTVLWSGTLNCGARTLDCLIVNVSAGGAMVRVETPDLCKKSVVLRSPRFGELAGEVTWRQGKELGIEFKETPEAVSKLLGKALP